MDKYIRNQIVEILSTVKEGIQHINSASTQGILIDDCTVALKSIDEACKDGLSKERYAYYQQILDGISKSLLEAKELALSDKVLEEVCTLACELLEFISKALLQETEVKKEILFLPYKASMWDSLESIWLAAKEDPQCNAYVMPIPYYDLGPDRKAIATHYEGKQFPNYVPITDYEKYDITERRPDIIYIHNPYDGYNRVTSVDPAYYSSELKKYTDMLVYVPYFVSKARIGEHFCQVPGVLYADKVIVQSEAIKEQYERYYPGGELTKDKFLALGSPKIDKVLNSKKEDFVLPDEWKRIIGNKKVVIYNTHLDGILNHPDAILNKLRYVFSCFKERKDIVLWWRPHPLGNATAQALQPAILGEYKAIEKEYRESGIGIFDDTADLHRAIAISDAYYGDCSSLVQMYGMTGKPIMLQDININKKSDSIQLVFTDIAIDGDKVWFVDTNLNVLFEMNCSTKDMKPIFLPEEIVGKSYTYLSLIKVENKLILAPYIGETIIEYDVMSKQFKKIKLLEEPYEKYPMINESKFAGVINYKSYVVFIGAGYPALIRYDSRTGEYKYYTDWFEKIEKYISNPNESLFGHRKSACIRGNSVLLPFNQDNIIMEFNIENGETKIHTVGKKGNSYFGIAFDGKDYWLIPYKNGPIVKWNYDTGIVHEYDKYPEDMIASASKCMFISIIHKKNSMVLFQGSSNMTIEVDIATGAMKMSEQWNGECAFASSIELDGVAVLNVQLNKNVLSYFDGITEKDLVLEMKLSDEKLKKIRNHAFDFNNNESLLLSYADCIIKENKAINTLSDLFILVNKKNNEIKEQQTIQFQKLFDHCKEPFGEKIFNYIMKL